MSAIERYVEAHGLRVHFWDHGGSGRAIVLLHGLASNARLWDLVAPLLAEHARVVALDQRGHGLSDKPDGGYDYATVAADLADLIVALGFERPVVAGHSWGANVAVEFAARYPAATPGIVLVDGGIFSAASLGWDWDEALKHWAPPRIAGTPKERLLGWIRDGDLKPFWQPRFEEFILAGFDPHEDGTVSPRLTYEHHLAIVRAMFEGDTVTCFPKIACPVLNLQCVQGRAASLVKRRLVKKAVGGLANVRTVWLKDSVHDVLLQRPERVAAEIQAFIRDDVR